MLELVLLSRNIGQKAWLSHESRMYELMWSTRTRDQRREPACGRMRRWTLPLQADRKSQLQKNNTARWELQERMIAMAQT